MDQKENNLPATKKVVAEMRREVEQRLQDGMLRHAKFFSADNVAFLLALIESQRATIERVERERDEADRRAGAAERDNAHRREADVKRQDWLDERKRALGYETGISFDRVWDDTLAKANRAEAAEARVTALEAEKAGLVKVLEPFADAANGLAPDLPATDQVLLTIDGLPIAWIYTDQLRAAAQALPRSSTEVKNDE